MFSKIDETGQAVIDFSGIVPGIHSQKIKRLEKEKHPSFPDLDNVGC
jgi:hypothetical protein